jgi:hypothetical protein
LQSVYKDSKLAYDDELKFIKPEVDKNDIIYDYFQNITGPPSPDAEGEDMGNGEITDYMGDDLFAVDTTIKAESEIPKAEIKPKPDEKPKPDTPIKKNTDPLIPANKPKAEMPAANATKKKEGQ